ncbi:MAG: DUF1573 domain-containing protein [Bacteroidetes bacterium]|nr:DUF1573 domain-containing protein [Bacteroidota bacterium]
MNTSFRLPLQYVLPLLGLFLFVFPAHLAAQGAKQNASLSVEGTSEYYFGEIEQSDTVEHTFVLKNNGKETVEITRAKASCGCTATVLSEKVLAPGKKTEIKVRFTPPRGSRNKVTKTVSVYVKGQEAPHTVLRISATVKSYVDIQPPSIQLTNMKQGEQVKTAVTITNVSDKALVVNTSGVSLTSYRDADDSGRKQAFPMQGGSVSPTTLNLAPGESKSLAITFKAEHEGQINGSVGLKIGNNSNVVYLFGIVAPKDAK